jgi:hypothetical protein
MQAIESLARDDGDELHFTDERDFRRSQTWGVVKGHFCLVGVQLVELLMCDCCKECGIGIRHLGR